MCTCCVSPCTHTQTLRFASSLRHILHNDQKPLAIGARFFIDVSSSFWVFLNSSSSFKTSSISMGKRWVSDEQLEFLTGQKNGYLKAALQRRYEPFLATLYEAWFERWSERTLLFGDTTPDSPSLTKDQNETLGKAIEKRKSVFMSPKYKTYTWLTLFSATYQLDALELQHLQGSRKSAFQWEESACIIRHPKTHEKVSAR